MLWMGAGRESAVPLDMRPAREIRRAVLQLEEPIGMVERHGMSQPARESSIDSRAAQIS
jgi:hypothetical protein